VSEPNEPKLLAWTLVGIAGCIALVVAAAIATGHYVP
jgi:hypothetical protein